MQRNYFIKTIYILFYPILLLLQFILYILLSFRHFLYDKNILKPNQFENILIICVGNLNFGGSGKTPLTNYLIELLKTRYKIAVLSRGYGRKTKGFRIVQVNDNFIECGDEPLMYKLKHPDIIVAVCENRAEGVRQLSHLYPDLQIILLDDAFQHRKIKADFNILVSDFSLPFYKDQLFPIGFLRDLKSRVKAADMLIYTKTPENTDNATMQQMIHQTKTYFSKDIFFSSIEYAHVYSIDTLQKINPYTELSKYNCILVTGIANPSPLALFIKEYAQHFYHLSFPDHHAFTDKDWDLIKNIYTEWQKKYPPVIIITTEKDAMRLKIFTSSYSNLPIFVAPISLQFINHSKIFSQQILNYVRTHPTISASHS